MCHCGGDSSKEPTVKCASPFKPEVPSRGPVSSAQIYCVMENEIPMVLYNVGLSFSQNVHTEVKPTVAL